MDTSDPRHTKSLVRGEMEASEYLLFFSSGTWWILGEADMAFLSLCVFVASWCLSIAKSRASSPEPPELRLDAPETLTDSGKEAGRGSGCARASGIGSEVVAATLLDKGDSGKNHGFFLGLVDAELGFDLDFGLDLDLLPFLQKARMA